MLRMIGHQHFYKDIQIVWGNRDCNLESIQQNFSELQLIKCKQTHSNLIHEWRSGINLQGVEGDALLTRESNAALCISTADCMPVMIYHEASSWIAGVHAGWKGVENRIIPMTLERLFAATGSKSDYHVWIGPHIQATSFEVGADVGQKILSTLRSEDSKSLCRVESVPPETSKNFPIEAAGPEKWNLDLAQVAKFQIEEAGFSLNHFWVSNEDTKTCDRYHSHRRDAAQSGRQLSFIFRR